MRKREALRALDKNGTLRKEVSFDVGDDGIFIVAYPKYYKRGDLHYKCFKGGQVPFYRRAAV